MQTEVAVFSNAGLWVDKADVVRASGDAVFAADAFVRVHRHDVGFRIAVSCLCRADANTGRIETLLTRNTNIFAFAVAGLDFSAVRASRSGFSPVLAL